MDRGVQNWDNWNGFGIAVSLIPVGSALPYRSSLFASSESSPPSAQLDDREHALMKRAQFFIVTM
jgi:hypothetical protein